MWVVHVDQILTPREAFQLLVNLEKKQPIAKRRIHKSLSLCEHFWPGTKTDFLVRGETAEVVINATCPLQMSADGKKHQVQINEPLYFCLV